jgi:ATP-dependent Clp protease ATP-binding subunit ClpC
VFEKYSGKSRRVVFFSRYEASQLGARETEPEHFLLAIIREDPAFLVSILRQGEVGLSLLRSTIETNLRQGPKLAGSVDLPLSQRAKAMISTAASEAESARDEWITSRHLMLGLVLDEGSLAARLLRDEGVTVQSIRQAPAGTSEALPRRKQSDAAQILAQLSALIDVLISRGVFSRQDLAEELANRYILPDLHATLNSLLAVLVRKGAINEFDRREIAGISEL